MKENDNLIYRVANGPSKTVGFFFEFNWSHSLVFWRYVRLVVLMIFHEVVSIEV